MILKSPAGSGQNVYNEYMYIDSKWELIGDTTVDLTGYATEEYVTSAIANKADKATTLAGYGITDAASKTELSDAVSTINTALQGTVATKADQTDLDALSDSVSALKEQVNGLVSSQITY